MIFNINLIFKYFFIFTKVLHEFLLITIISDINNSIITTRIVTKTIFFYLKNTNNLFIQMSKTFV
jgi:hypothetical protein